MPTRPLNIVADLTKSPPFDHAGQFYPFPLEGPVCIGRMPHGTKEGRSTVMIVTPVQVTEETGKVSHTTVNGMPCLFVVELTLREFLAAADALRAFEVNDAPKG
jgi:hypothetical protein